MNTTLHITSDCYHCGAACESDAFGFEEKNFCCNGCKTVYSILSKSNLCGYYNLNSHPAIAPIKLARKGKYDFLDNDDIKQNIIRFQNSHETQVQFYLPQIHCSSCLWLLENLTVLDNRIIGCKVFFVQKEIFVRYYSNKISLKEIVQLLASIGYEPHFSLHNIQTSKANNTSKTRILKLGVAGFCFANIMMLSFPEYLNGGKLYETTINSVLQYLSILLSLPVLFYAAAEFFTSAFKALLNKYINLDAPVALAIALTFCRSIYEIYTGTGSGYLDSMAGIVFFMLIGRWVQEQTYKTIAFDRDYKSFFPIAVDVLKNNIWVSTAIDKIQEKDVVKIYSEDIIPFDGLLSKGKALIDYSFVTGETLPVEIEKGSFIYAGAKQKAESIEVVVVKPVSQSYLTNLWNNEVFKYKSKPKPSYTDIWGKYFTLVVFAIAVIASIYWYKANNIPYMLNAITTVLIVACPCALLLAENYTNGSIIKIFNANKFYVRDASIIKLLASIKHIVFDKTGTITDTSVNEVKYHGNFLLPEEKQIIASILQHSNHPLSKSIINYLGEQQLLQIDHYKNHIGKGIEAWVNDTHIKIGNVGFVGQVFQSKSTCVCIMFNKLILGYFEFKNNYIPNILSGINSMSSAYDTSILSGDNDGEYVYLKNNLPNTNLYFNQSPQQKLAFIQLANNIQPTLMIGDGLNDAGALKAACVGIAVSNANNSFTPASDVVMNAEQLPTLKDLLRLSKTSRHVIAITFTISAVYNAIGLWYAVQGVLQPVIAAILMPLSSITIIAITYLATHYKAQKLRLKTDINN